jgi:hypothetical protein
MRAVYAVEYDGKIGGKAGALARKFDQDQACDKRR